MPRLLVVFGTRPEAIKLAPVIAALRGMPDLETRVCTTGQHRELLDRALAATIGAPDIDLDLMTPGQGLDALTARLLLALGETLDVERPDRVIVQGDTTSAMAAALAAYHRRIPIAHVEAGLRTGNRHQPWPEEANRRIIATIADLHFAPTVSAANALLIEGCAPGQIHITGNSGIDSLLAVRGLLKDGTLAAPVVTGLVERFAGRRIIAVTCHRRENWTAGLDGICAALRDVAARDDVAIVLPLHPNPQVGDIFRVALGDLANVALIDALDHAEFVALLDASHLVLTDSGGVQEEAPALGKPVLVLRETTERPEGVAAGMARLVGTDRTRIVDEANRLLDDAQAYGLVSRAHSPYGDGGASRRIARIVASAVA
jgi:UDP-N-acetylglucosamine 2-epimerase (non-hydrolysing)